MAPLILTRKVAGGVGAAVLALNVCACSTPASDEPFAGSSTDVSEATWSDGVWPLTVSRGVLGCTVPNQVTFNDNGNLYGLNGTALDHGLPPIDPIWKPDGNIRVSNARVSIGPMIDAGLKLCDPPSAMPS